MPAKQMFRASYKMPSQQVQAQEGRVALRKLDPQAGRFVRPSVKINKALVQPRSVFYAPEHEWIVAAAERAVQISPRPNQLHIIRNLKRVSYNYADIVMGFVGRYKNPVEALVYQCLLDRLEAARIATIDPGSELQRLRQKANSRNWPSKVFQRKRRALEVILSNQRQDLDLYDLFALAQQLYKLDGKRRGIEIRVGELWHSTKKRRGPKKLFAIRNQELHDKLRACKNEIYTTKMELWEAWFDKQVVKIFHEIEADIVRMAQFGKLKKDEQPKGRRAIRSDTSLWRPRPVVVIAEVDICQGKRTVFRVLAVVSPGDYQKKQSRRIKPQKTKYCNRSSKSMRPSYR